MESGSQASDPAERSSHKFANVVGTLIAVLTLTVPIVAIARFSSLDVTPNWQPPASLFTESEGTAPP